jgi:hypothetical protein
MVEEGHKVLAGTAAARLADDRDCVRAWTSLGEETDVRDWLGGTTEWPFRRNRSPSADTPSGADAGIGIIAAKRGGRHAARTRGCGHSSGRARLACGSREAGRGKSFKNGAEVTSLSSRWQASLDLIEETGETGRSMPC